MRKVITLITTVSLMLCVVTAGAGAASPQDLNHPREFEIKLGVPHWAVIETGTEAFNLDFTALDHDNAVAVSASRRVVIRSNDHIDVVLEQDWTELARTLGITTDALLWGGSGDQDYVISPNVIVRPIDGSNNMTGLPSNKDNAGWYNSPKFTFQAGQGANAFDLRMDARVNDSNPRWTYLTAGTHTGKLIMTVSAGNQTD